MKKLLIFVLCAMLCASIAGCGFSGDSAPNAVEAATLTQQPSPSATAALTSPPTEKTTPVVTPSPTPVPTLSPEPVAVQAEMPVPTETPAPTQTPVPTVVERDPQGETVYWVPKGKVWHTTPNCSTLSRSKTILSGTIGESGKPRVCKRCG